MYIRELLYFDVHQSANLMTPRDTLIDHLPLRVLSFQILSVIY